MSIHCKRYKHIFVLKFNMARYLDMLYFVLFCITDLMAYDETKDLSHKHLPEVKSISDQIPLNTEQLILNHNNISAVSSDDFENLDVLEYVDLSHNFLTIFPNLSSIAKTLCILGLTDNRLRMIPAQHLDILSKLEALYLSNNNLKTIPDVAGPSNSLSYLNVQANNFESFPPLEKLGKSLFKLYINDNKIANIYAADLMLNQLEWLYIQSNQLRSLPVICGAQIKFMDFTNNPLVCDKYIAWQLTGVQYFDGTCDSPQHLKGERVDGLLQKQLGITEGECLWWYKKPICQVRPH